MTTRYVVSLVFLICFISLAQAAYNYNDMLAKLQTPKQCCSKCPNFGQLGWTRFLTSLLGSSFARNFLKGASLVDVSPNDLQKEVRNVHVMRYDVKEAVSLKGVYSCLSLVMPVHYYTLIYATDNSAYVYERADKVYLKKLSPKDAKALNTGPDVHQVRHLVNAELTEKDDGTPWTINDVAEFAKKVGKAGYNTMSNNCQHTAAGLYNLLKGVCPVGEELPFPDPVETKAIFSGVKKYCTGPCGNLNRAASAVRRPFARNSPTKNGNGGGLQRAQSGGIRRSQSGGLRRSQSSGLTRTSSGGLRSSSSTRTTGRDRYQSTESSDDSRPPLRRSSSSRRAVGTPNNSGESSESSY